MRSLRLAIALCLSAVCGIAVAAPPKPLHIYQGREIAPTMSYHGANWLMRENRESEEHCTQMLGALKLKAGQTVVDMGCGNGFYTVPLSKLVGKEGRVLAVDVQPEMLTLLRANLRKQNITNVRPLLGELWNPRLPDGEVDVILLVDVYHEFSHPVHMLAAMHKSLKPGGRLALVEFREEDITVPIKPEHKMSKAQILKEIPPNGFKLVEQYDELPWQHLMFFEKDESAADESAKPQAGDSSEMQ
jgi:ubiquinone/menaquinone biosynthesis C-methylase UbiE